MFTKRSLTISLSIAALGAVVSPANAAGNGCFPIGGVAIADFFGEGEGKPIVISATMTGAVASTAGKIVAQRETPTGLEMDMEHYFGSNDGGAFKTRDLAVLTAIPGKPGRFMSEITYRVQEDVTRGTLKGVSGTFRSYGLVDLRDPNNLVGVIRYSGEICR